MSIILYIISFLFIFAFSCCTGYYEICQFISCCFNFMSATVDSSLFAWYFRYCPVISVEVTIDPVSTHFFKDVYEKMEYCLALYSRASGAYFAQHGEKVPFAQFLFLVSTHRSTIGSPFSEPYCWSDYCCFVSFTISCRYPMFQTIYYIL